MSNRRATKHNDSVTTRCDCGATHRVDRRFVGTCDWWVCIPCLDRKSAAFAKKHGLVN